MGATWQYSPAVEARRPGIRAVVADFDESRCDAVCRVLAAEGFCVIAEVNSLAECQRVVGDEMPELLVCPAAVLPERPVEQPFPLWISVGNAPSCGRLVCCLEQPIREPHLVEALSAATTRILTAKAGELSSLIHRYVLHGDAPPATVPCLHIEVDGLPLELNPDQIRWIRAAGNYVELFTARRSYEMRESIGRLALRLERSGFVRIRRDVVVNSAAIRHQVLLNDLPVAIVLDDGTRLRVGPNFRDRIPPNTAVSHNPEPGSERS